MGEDVCIWRRKSWKVQVDVSNLMRVRSSELRATGYRNAMILLIFGP